MRLLNILSNLGLTFCLIFFSSCAMNPVTGKKQVVLMSEAQEISMGKAADPEVTAFFGLYAESGFAKIHHRKRPGNGSHFTPSETSL